MAIVYLVRHAQASFGSRNYDQLSELGHRQARWLGEWFAEQGIAFRRVLAGTLQRQQQTAIEIVAATGGDTGQIVTHPGLDEYQGEAIWAAHTAGADPIEHQRADYRAYWRTFREAMSYWADDRLADVPETWAQFGARVNDAIAVATQDTKREDALLVVSSGGAISRYVGQLLGCPASIAIELNLQFRNTGFCELIAGGERVRLLSYNSIPHLMQADRRESITFA